LGWEKRRGKAEKDTLCDIVTLSERKVKGGGCDDDRMILCEKGGRITVRGHRVDVDLRVEKKGHENTWGRPKEENKREDG